MVGDHAVGESPGLSSSTQQGLKTITDQALKLGDSLLLLGDDSAIIEKND